MSEFFIKYGVSMLTIVTAFYLAVALVSFLGEGVTANYLNGIWRAITYLGGSGCVSLIIGYLLKD